MLETKMNKLPLRVDVSLHRDQLIKWMQPKTIAETITNVQGVCLDSRVIEPGDMFFALKAARDGHEFARGALEKGASAIVVDHDMGLEHQIIVDSTLIALQILAKQFRLSWGKTVVGVSGSNGKTTTKEILQTLLGENAFCTPGTWNNHLGIPLSILMLRDHHEVAVMEMGINDFGDLKGYCEYALPNIGVLTVIGDSHLMNLSNKEGVKKAKGELFEALPEDGVAIINIDDPYLHPFVEKLFIKSIKVSTLQDTDVFVKAGENKSIHVDYSKESFETDFKLNGRHNQSNLACALGVCLALGVPAQNVATRISAIVSLEMRMQEVQIKDNIRLIMDCYNANPTSTRAGLNMVSTLSGRKLILLGDMLELGTESSKIHMDVAKGLKEVGIDHAFLVGQFAKDYYQGALLGGLLETQLTILDDRDIASEKIRAELQSGDILYVKGSRGMRLEEIIQPLL